MAKRARGVSRELLSEDDSTRHTLTEKMVDALRKAVLHGDILLSEVITEAAAVERFNSSLNPIRVALRQLAGEELITILPRVGAIIKHLTAPDLEDAKELWSTLIAARISTHSPAGSTKSLTEIASRMKQVANDKNGHNLVLDIADQFFGELFAQNRSLLKGEVATKCFRLIRTNDALYRNASLAETLPDKFVN